MGIADSLSGWVTKWWRGDAGISGRVVSVLTAPLEVGFRGASRARNRLYDRQVFESQRVGVPVISVGNLSLGGTGKTPVSAWVARFLLELGRSPSILLRGYGMDEVEVHRELNPEVPVAVGRDRGEIAAAAIATGADCLVLDDGFQHRRLYRDLDIVLIAAEQWTGQHRLLPRGPWRESEDALRRADFVLVTRKSASLSEGERVLEAVRRAAPRVPSGLVHLRLSDFVAFAGGEGGERGGEGKGAVSGFGSALGPGRRVTALSSLGNPLAFEEQLRDLGADVAPLRYPDHHAFSADDVRKILGSAEGTTLVMTRKEAVKLRGMLPPDFRAVIADQTMAFDQGEQALEGLLRGVVSAQ